jgi:hypothetical protein
MKATRFTFAGWGISSFVLAAAATCAAAVEDFPAESLMAASPVAPTIRVHLKDGTTREATSARLWWLGRVQIGEGESTNEVPRGDVSAIRDGQGVDWTRDVLGGKQIFQGDSPAPTRRGAYGNIHAFRRWYPLTEAGVMFRINEPYRNPEFRGNDPRADQIRFLGDYGAMVNLNRSAALGGTVFASAYEDGGSVGFRGRYRRWLSPLSSLDLSLGASFAGWSQYGEPQPFAPIAGVTYSFRDQVLVKVQVDVTNFDTGDRDVALTGGVSIGSKGGAITSVVAAIIGAIVGATAAVRSYDPYGGVFQ